MKRYIALLRGINISGKNKIPMAELKSCFIEFGYVDVFTHLNSGNVVFLADENSEIVLADKIKVIIQERFKLDIPVFVISQQELKDILNHSPDCWGNDNKEIYDNLIFMLPPLTYEAFCDEVGNPKDEYEKVYNYSNAVFWSFSRKDYQKTNWWSKTANANVSDMITIRTANTVRRIVEI